MDPKKKRAPKKSILSDYVMLLRRMVELERERIALRRQQTDIEQKIVAARAKPEI